MYKRDKYSKDMIANMQAYKTILKFSEEKNWDCERYYKEIIYKDRKSEYFYHETVIFNSIERFSVVKINQNLISEIYTGNICNLIVLEDYIDDFLSFFLKRKICLLEKCSKSKHKYFLNYIKEKIWKHTTVVCAYNSEIIEDSHSFIFENVNYNIVVMNNNSKIVVPFV